MIIGLTGRIAAGKGVSAEFFRTKNFEYLSLSNEVRAEATKRGIVHEREKLQDLGNLIRKEEGTGALVKRVNTHIKSYSNYIIDGIRNLGEVEELNRIYCNEFVLLSLDAPVEIRWRNVQKRGKVSDPKTFEEFLLADNRDYEENIGNGQQVRECMARADYHLYNDNTIEGLNCQLKKIYSEIVKKC